MEYISQVFTPKLSSRFLGKVKVPTGGLTAGSVVVADSLDSSIVGNIEVFSATQPNTTNINGSNFFALVLNDGFEELSDDRRPDGQPDYYQYTYKEGDIAPIVFLEKHIVVNIGIDSINQTTKTLAVEGNYLIPTNGSYLLSASETIPSGVSNALKILGLYNTPIGGNYGGNFALSLICVPVTKEIDTGNRILTFSVPNQVGDAVINSTTGTIDIICAGSRSSLAATFTAQKDAVVTVGGVVQVSGSTVNNFTSPVTYTVTSESGASREYVVTVTLATYDLAITTTEGSAVSVTKDGTPISAGSDVLTFGDVITITQTIPTGSELVSLEVNGESFVSGNTLSVAGDVSIVLTTQQIPYTLTVTNTSSGEISITNGGVAIESGATIYYGDILTITYEGNLVCTIGANTYTSGSEYTVVGDTTIVVTNGE